MTIFAVFTLTLQKPRMPQIQGVKGALQQRAHSPARFIGTEGLASESENVTVPYSGSFSAACRSTADLSAGIVAEIPS